ncbi:MAG TPA: Gfo/Idh/MocA family oxidoreductase [Streptosporangiaceae bacterium]|jgi:predicted dehydrogenase
MTAAPRTLRLGLAGTGYWARSTHAPALASTDGVELAAVWGRNPQAARDLAARYAAASYPGFGDFLAAVDAVAFSVPPDVQAGLAAQAAAAGKHLLLEKPVATSRAGAARLAEAVADARVASVVFFTALFRPDVRSWLAQVTGQGGWAGGSAVWLATSLAETSPFNTPWRRDKGGLWDVAPHAVALLEASLGPVLSVTADAGPPDVSHLILHHASGVTSTVTATLRAAEAAEGFELYLWGEAGRSALPADPNEPVSQLRVALAELADNARSGAVAHPCDVHLGRRVTAVLASAEEQIERNSRGWPPPSGPAASPPGSDPA